MTDSEPIELGTGSRQTHVKLCIKIIAIVDMIHVVFPICFFVNLFIASAVSFVGGPNSYKRPRSMVYFAPVCIVGIVVLSYGVIIAIRLFNSSHPGMPPVKSAKLALCWWHYAIFIVIFQLIASASYFYLSLKTDEIVGQMFSFMMNFSVAVRLISIYIVRRFIKEMRSYQTRVAPESRSAQLKRPHILHQRVYHMRFMAKVLIVLDLIQNTFLLLCLIYVFLAIAYEFTDMKVNLSYAIINLLLSFGTVVGVYFAIYTGFKLLKSLDKNIIDNQPIHEMAPNIQLLIHKILLKWMFCSVGCIVLGEMFCLWLVIIYGDAYALIYTLGLSFSFGVRAVSFYLMRRFRTESFTKPEGYNVRMSLSISTKSSSRSTVVSFKESETISEVQSLPKTSKPALKLEPQQKVTVPSPNVQPQASESEAPSPPRSSAVASPALPTIPITSPVEHFISNEEQVESMSMFVYWKDKEPS